LDEQGREVQHLGYDGKAGFFTWKNRIFEEWTEYKIGLFTMAK
jgi:hypothetical protein